MATISVGDAKSRFSELISRASAGERFVIQRRERPVAALISSAELERLERTSKMALQLARALGQRDAVLRHIEEGKAHPIMAASGLWADEEDLADLAERIAQNRERSGRTRRAPRL
jgi:prevent-host-death family protein